MAKSERLKPVAELAKDQEQMAALEYGKSQKVLNEKKYKLKELNQYKSEYLDKYHQIAQQGMSGASLQQYHLFINQLDNVIRSQEGEIEKADVEFNGIKNQWYKKHCKSKAINSAVQNFRKQEVHIKNKLEQVEADERNMQQKYQF